jgi:hypothetical protein
VIVMATASCDSERLLNVALTLHPQPWNIPFMARIGYSVDHRSPSFVPSLQAPLTPTIPKIVLFSWNQAAPVSHFGSSFPAKVWFGRLFHKNCLVSFLVLICGPILSGSLQLWTLIMTAFEISRLFLINICSSLNSFTIDTGYNQKLSFLVLFVCLRALLRKCISGTDYH